MGAILAYSAPVHRCHERASIGRDIGVGLIKTMRDAWNYLGFMLGLREFLQCRMTLDEGYAILEKRMQERESNFLSTLETCVLSASHSPYPALFKQAGAEFGDVVDGVKRDGLEPTLRALLDAINDTPDEQLEALTPAGPDPNEERADRGGTPEPDEPDEPEDGSEP